jgi:hypothetical protein
LFYILYSYRETLIAPFEVLLQHLPGMFIENNKNFRPAAQCQDRGFNEALPIYEYVKLYNLTQSAQYIYICMCVCVCVYIYICVCVRVCV